MTFTVLPCLVKALSSGTPGSLNKVALLPTNTVISKYYLVHDQKVDRAYPQKNPKAMRHNNFLEHIPQVKGKTRCGKPMKIWRRRGKKQRNH